MPERTVWWFGLLALGIAFAACGGGSDAPESAALPTLVATATATTTTVATPTPTPSPTATSTTTAAGTPAEMANPTPEPAPPERWHPDIVEVETDLFERLEYAPGETITGYGLFLLDIGTGRVEGWREQGMDAPWQDTYSIPFGGRFLGLQTLGAPIAPYLHDRRSGRTFAWDWQAHPLREFATERGERLIVERADEAPGQYVVLDGGLTPVAWFELPSGGQRLWMNPAGDRVLAFDRAAFHVINLATGRMLRAEAPAGTGPLHVSRDYIVREQVALFASDAGDGFALIGRDTNSREQCRVVRYDWTAAILSDVAFRCAGVLPKVALSPNGRGIASETFTNIYDTEGLIGTYSPLTIISVFDALTGEEIIRARSVLLDQPSDNSLGLVRTTSWLADSSGIVVTAIEPTINGDQRQSRILDVDGHWQPSPSMREAPSVHDGWFAPFAAPAPESSSLFLLTRGTVVNRNDEVVASFTIDFPGIPPPDYGFVCYSTWWNAPEEVAVLIRGCGHTSWSDVLPPLPPGIALPPFDERLLMAVTTVETCSGFHEEPSAEATRIACLPNATVVELLASDGVESYVDGYPVAVISAPDRFMWHTPGCDDGSGDGACVWLHVRDADGVEGWMLANDLTWVP